MFISTKIKFAGLLELAFFCRKLKNMASIYSNLSLLERLIVECPQLLLYRNDSVIYAPSMFIKRALDEIKQQIPSFNIPNGATPTYRNIKMLPYPEPKLVICLDSHPYADPSLYYSIDI